MVARTENTEKTPMNSIPKLPKRPNFKNEAEEAEWWYKNRKIVEARLDATQAISIRLPVSDLELVKRQAADKGIGYQTLIRMILREGLKKHDRRSTRKAS